MNRCHINKHQSPNLSKARNESLYTLEEEIRQSLKGHKAVLCLKAFVELPMASKLLLQKDNPINQCKRSQSFTEYTDFRESWHYFNRSKWKSLRELLQITSQITGFRYKYKFV